MWQFGKLTPEQVPEDWRPVLPDFKTQVQRDTKAVFLNLREFGVLKDIRYWVNGYAPNVPGREPLRMRIPVVMEAEGVYDGSWQKNSQRAKAGSTIMYQKDDNVLYQNSVTFFCALEDFGQMPKKGRRLELDGRMGKISGVSVDNGMLTISLTEFDD